MLMSLENAPFMTVQLDELRNYLLIPSGKLLNTISAAVKELHTT